MIIQEPIFNKKTFESLWNCPDISDACDLLVEEILFGDSETIIEAIQKSAEDSIDIYYDELFKAATYEFSDYIDRVATEYGLNPDGDGYLIKLLQYAEGVYYEEQLIENCDDIMQNVLIEFIKRMTIVSDVSYDPTDILDFIEEYIDNVSVDIDDNVDSVINNFKKAVSSKFDVEFKDLRRVA